MNYHGQVGQDRWVDEQLLGKRNGVFVELGAQDGVIFSNTLFFEKHRGWKGLCIDANPSNAAKLQKNRKCISYNCCVGAAPAEDVDFLQLTGYTEALSGILSCFDERHKVRIERELNQHGGTKTIVKVPQRTITELCLESGFTKIDYFSLDVTGAELEVLKGLDFSQITVEIFSIENNYPDKFTPIHELLTTNGYTKVHEVYPDVFYRKTQ